jgi:CarD family transcriptional regulator
VFKTGEMVVHPQYGAGVVVELRTITYQGRERKYFCIELVQKRGTLMLPAEDIEAVGLRLPITDITLLKEVFADTPESLPEDTYARQSALEAKLNSGNLRKAAQALRDLCWREYTLKISFSERKLKEQAISRIMDELILNPAYTIGTVKLTLDQLIDAAMQSHLETQKAVVK